MKKEDLVKLGLTEEQIAEVFKIRGQEVEAGKQKLSEIEDAKRALEDKVKELESIKLTQEQYEALKTEKEQLEQKVADMENTHAQELTKVQYNHLLEAELKAAGVKNMKFAKLALEELGEDAVKFEDGKINGITEAIKTLKESSETSLLFETEKPGQSILSFSDKLGGNGGDSNVDPFDSAFGKYSSQ